MCLHQIINSDLLFNQQFLGPVTLALVFFINFHSIVGDLLISFSSHIYLHNVDVKYF